MRLCTNCLIEIKFVKVGERLKVVYEEVYKCPKCGKPVSLTVWPGMNAGRNRD